MRSPESNNQVFFVDTSGALCSRSSGHAVDVEGAFIRPPVIRALGTHPRGRRAKRRPSGPPPQTTRLAPFPKRVLASPAPVPLQQTNRRDIRHLPLRSDVPGRPGHPRSPIQRLVQAIVRSLRCPHAQTAHARRQRRGVHLIGDQHAAVVSYWSCQFERTHGDTRRGVQRGHRSGGG